MSLGFRHTHTIVAVQHDGSVERVCVTVGQSDLAAGCPLYTEPEWDGSDTASWEYDPERGLLHLGRVPDWCRSTELRPALRLSE